MLIHVTSRDLKLVWSLRSLHRALSAMCIISTKVKVNSSFVVNFVSFLKFSCLRRR